MAHTTPLTPKPEETATVQSAATTTQDQASPPVDTKYNLTVRRLRYRVLITQYLDLLDDSSKSGAGVLKQMFIDLLLAAREEFGITNLDQFYIECRDFSMTLK